MTVKIYPPICFVISMPALAGAQTNDIHDIKPPLDYPSSFLLPWIALMLIFIAAGVILWVWFKKKDSTGSNKASLKESWEVASGSLNALLSHGLFEKGCGKKFFTELSLILRRYIEDRFRIKAGEMTTEEFLAYARQNKELPDRHRDLIAQFMTFSDVVKFARHSPSSEDMNKAVMTVKGFIEETKEG